MYTKQDIISYAESLGTTAVMQNDRIHYISFIEECEIFAHRRGLIVTAADSIRHGAYDAASRDLVTPDDFRYEFYSKNLVKDARMLADKMYECAPSGLGHYTNAMTKISGNLMAINVDIRELVVLKALPVYRGIRVVDIIDTAEMPAKFAKDEGGAPLMLQCVGLNTQLMYIYGQLINPVYAGTWGKLLDIERKLKEQFISSFDISVPSYHEQGPILTLLIDKYIAGSDKVLIGGKAVELLTGERQSIQKLQVITGNDLESEAEEITRILQKESISTYWKIDDLKNPLYPNIMRMTIHHEARDGKHLILDVYNSAAFMVIPYTQHGDVKVGSVFVINQYKLIDLLSIMILQHMGLIAPQHAALIINTIKNEMVRFSSYTTADLFPLDYIGRFVDEELVLKREIQSQKESMQFHPPYYPLRGAQH